MTILASKSAFSSHCTAFESCLAVSVRQPKVAVSHHPAIALWLGCLFPKTHSSTCAYLGVASLVGQVSSMDQHIALWQLDGGVVGVADADNPSPPRGTRHGFRGFLQGPA
jgi:hypothetical protein